MKGKHGAAAAVRRDWTALEARAEKAERDLARTRSEFLRARQEAERHEELRKREIAALKTDIENATSEEVRALNEMVGKLIGERDDALLQARGSRQRLQRMVQRSADMLASAGVDEVKGRALIAQAQGLSQVDYKQMADELNADRIERPARMLDYEPEVVAQVALDYAKYQSESSGMTRR
jgi:triphosphoribosyl-dephospho-CoA synthetase